MKYGVMIGEGSGAAPDLDALVERAQLAERAGLDSAWIGNIVLDALTAAAVAGSATETIEIGTFVTPIPNRHPATVVQQAETAQMACNGRFTLGLGSAHRFRVEQIWGLTYDRPAARMRAYLESVVPVLQGEKVVSSTDYHQVKLVPNPLAPNTQVLIAALGPIMLELAGELATGTVTWAAGPKTLAEHVLPTIKRFSSDARVVAGFPIAVTANKEAAWNRAERLFGPYSKAPSYKAMLEREGVASLEQLSLIGTEQEVSARLKALEDIGVTDFCGYPFATEPGEIDRTIEFLGSKMRSAGT